MRSIKAQTSAAAAGAIPEVGAGDDADRDEIPAGGRVDALPERRQLVPGQHRPEAAGVEALELGHYFFAAMV
jgi:hypothetical protein